METEDSQGSERLAKLKQRVAVIERDAHRLRVKFDREVAPRPEPLADKFRPKIGRFYHYRPRALRHPEGYEASASELSPTITIVTPSFNQHQFVKATIDSVLAQNYPALRYHVQDAASTDGTVDLLKTYDGKLSWSSVPDHGQAHGLNVGFRSFGGDGDIMAYLNSDDVLMPGALAYVAKAFADNPDVDVVYGHRICIDEDGMEIGRWILPKHDPVAIKWFDFGFPNDARRGACRKSHEKVSRLRDSPPKQRKKSSAPRCTTQKTTDNDVGTTGTIGRKPRRIRSRCQDGRARDRTLFATARAISQAIS